MTLEQIRRLELSLPQSMRTEYCELLIGVVMIDMHRSYGPDGEIEGDDFLVFTASAEQRLAALEILHK